MNGLVPSFPGIVKLNSTECIPNMQIRFFQITLLQNFTHLQKEGIYFRAVAKDAHLKLFPAKIILSCNHV